MTAKRTAYLTISLCITAIPFKAFWMCFFVVVCVYLSIVVISITPSICRFIDTKISWKHVSYATSGDQMMKSTATHTCVVLAACMTVVTSQEGQITVDAHFRLSLGTRFNHSLRPLNANGFVGTTTGICSLFVSWSTTTAPGEPLWVFLAVVVDIQASEGICVPVVPYLTCHIRE